MKNGWQTTTLGELCRFIDYRGKTPEKTVSGLRLITAKNVKMGYLQETPMEFVAPESYDAWMTRGIPKMGDVLFTTEAPLANVAQLDTNEKVVFAQRIIVLQPAANNLDRTFLKYLLLSDVAQSRILEQGTGATVQGIKASLLKTIPIEFPPLPEQQRIVGKLDETFAGLATAKANAEKNLQNARALFESHLQSVFTQRGKGWVEKKLSEVCAITSTLVDPRKKEFLNLTHVGAGNIESKTGVFVDLKTVREEGLISGKFLFDESMVLYSKIRPYLMKVARPDFPGLCSADMYPLAPFSKEIVRDYLFHLLLSKEFTDYAILGSARAGMPKVNREHLFEFKLWLPDVKKQKEFAAKLDDLHEKTQRLASIYEQKLAALEALKKSLLHHAFTGQLK